MEKVSQLNTVTPRKRQLSRWGLTTKEGGMIHYFTFPESDSAYKRMCEHVTDWRNWGKYRGRHPEGSGSRNYTEITIVPDFGMIKVHSLFFPDGAVWDSTLRDFRKIRDYERRS